LRGDFTHDPQAPQWTVRAAPSRSGPRERARFFLADTGEEMRAADTVAFTSDGHAWI